MPLARHRRTEQPTSVRGMYYMAMGAGLIDKDAQGKRNNYMRVQRRLLQMRRDGRMPYSWITDGSRTIYGYDRFADEDDFSAYAANIYRKDYWLESPVRVEVWVEKDAMAGKLKPVVCDEYGLDLYVSRGFRERNLPPGGRCSHPVRWSPDLRLLADRLRRVGHGHSRDGRGKACADGPAGRCVRREDSRHARADRRVRAHHPARHANR